MTIAELIQTLQALPDHTRLVAVWNPSQDFDATDSVRLINGWTQETISLDDQADVMSDNYPIYDDNNHVGAETAVVVILG